jgi:hypothetical protein
MREPKHTPHISITMRDSRYVAAVEEYLEANLLAALCAFQDAEIAIFNNQYPMHLLGRQDAALIKRLNPLCFQRQSDFKVSEQQWQSAQRS